MCYFVMFAVTFFGVCKPNSWKSVHWGFRYLQFNHRFGGAHSLWMRQKVNQKGMWGPWETGVHSLAKQSVLQEEFEIHNGPKTSKGPDRRYKIDRSHHTADQRTAFRKLKETWRNNYTHEQYTVRHTSAIWPQFTAFLYKLHLPLYCFILHMLISIIATYL